MTVELTSRETWANAIEKAQKVQPNFRKFDDGLWIVNGDKNIYFVKLSNAGALPTVQCECKANQRNIPCYHAAAVLLHVKGAAGPKAFTEARTVLVDTRPVAMPLSAQELARYQQIAADANRDLFGPNDELTMHGLDRLEARAAS